MSYICLIFFFFFFQAEDGIRDWSVTGVQTCALPIYTTDDLPRRFASHQQGHVVSTSKYLPAVLRSYVAVADEATARRLERYFKQVPAKPLPGSASCRRANDERCPINFAARCPRTISRPSVQPGDMGNRTYLRHG